MDFLWLILYILFYGLLIAYLVALIPAAVLMARRKAWAYFAAGFVTFGLAWFVGAIQVVDFSKRSILIGCGAVLLVGFFATFPVLLTGVQPGPLQSSVGGFMDERDECKPKGDDWVCWSYDNSISGSRPYLVDVGWDGCWEATAIRRKWESPGSIGEPEVSGCVTLIHYF
ncbi:MAG: hypothetical protein KDB52_03585 [Solirubrobacterales bacterium]|nr:hypothetical protein [Solirubrobacterales bacterium]